MKLKLKIASILLSICMIFGMVIQMPQEVSAATVKTFTKTYDITGNLDSNGIFSETLEIASKCDLEITLDWSTDCPAEKSRYHSIYFSFDQIYPYFEDCFSESIYETSTKTWNCTVDEGEFDIFSEIDNYSKYNCNATVTITGSYYPSMSKSKASIKKGATTTLSVSNTEGNPSWSSSNKKIATVSSKGVVKGVGIGTAKITATVGDKQCTATITVTDPVKLSKSTQTLAINETYTLKITGTKSKVSWSSSDKSIATVDSKGKVTAKKKGTATITAKVDGRSYKCKFTINKPAVFKSKSVKNCTAYNKLSFELHNYSKKKITYVEVSIKQYKNNNAYICTKKYHVNSTINSGSSYYGHWWVDDNCMKFKISITKVYFSDGSTWTP